MPSAANPFVGLLQEFRDAYIEFDSNTLGLVLYTYEDRSKRQEIQSGRMEVIACVSWPRADATKPDYEFFVATESNYAVRLMQDRFKQLSTLAGASLPVMIRDSIREIVSTMAEPLTPLEWWVAFLWFHNPPAEETLAWAEEGPWVIWSDPFLASVEAIERCGLHIGEIRFPAAVAKLAATQESTNRSQALPEGGNAAQGDDPTAGGPWSKPDGPTQWAKKYRCSQRTWVDTRIAIHPAEPKPGQIRVKKHSTKSYSVHVDDLPKEASET